MDAIEFCGERLHGTAKTHTFAGTCACRDFTNSSHLKVTTIPLVQRSSRDEQYARHSL